MKDVKYNVTRGWNCWDITHVTVMDGQELKDVYPGNYAELKSFHKILRIEELRPYGVAGHIMETWMGDPTGESYIAEWSELNNLMTHS